MNFKEAFASARKAGKKEFTWNGKRYNTKYKEEVAGASRPRTRSTSANKAKDGRGDGNYERVVRGADAAIKRATAGKPPSVMSTAPTRGADPKPIAPMVRAGSKPAAPKAVPKTPVTKSRLTDNPISRGASNLGRKVGELLNGKSRKKPVKLDPKDNKHPYD